MTTCLSVSDLLFDMRNKRSRVTDALQWHLKKEVVCVACHFVGPLGPNLLLFSRSHWNWPLQLPFSLKKVGLPCCASPLALVEE